MAQLVWTKEAGLWLKEIFDFIALDNPVAAANVVDGIYDKAQLLEDYPELGYPYEHASGKDIRITLYGHYRIAYLVDLPDYVHILGIFHGSLKIENYLL